MSQPVTTATDSLTAALKSNIIPNQEYLLQGSVLDTAVEVLLHRLRGLCDNVDSGPETFHDHEMCFSIRKYPCTKCVALYAQKYVEVYSLWSGTFMMSLGLWSLYCLVILKLSLCKDGNLYASSFMVTYFTLHIIHWLRKFCTEIARLQSGFTCAFRQVGCPIWWACWNGLICHHISFQTINVFCLKHVWQIVCSLRELVNHIKNIQKWILFGL